MKLPLRPASHLTEAASWRLLQALAPENWIVREVTERDYGIDAYIEIATSAGEITGDLILIQLKGTESLDWKGSIRKDRRVEKNEKGSINNHISRSPQIATSTANYWERLPVPVFLFVAEISTRNIYFCPVKSFIRKEYRRLSKQETMTFPLMKGLNLSEKIGPPLVEFWAGKERMHRDFVNQISALISHAETFHNFIEMSQGRDCFMEVGAEVHLRFRALYHSCEMAASYLEIEWPVESLQDLYERDFSHFRDRYCLLHELTLTDALKQIEGIFPKILRSSIELVEITEAHYWKTHDPVLYEICFSNELDWLLQRMEDDKKRRRRI